jgi:CRISPR-associated protein Cas1
MREVGRPIHRKATTTAAYGVLESQVRMQVVAAGLDPTIGILHGNARGQHGLVYDLMEPQRPIVDRKVLEFVQSRTFHPADFTLANNGICRLNPELARNVVRAVATSRDKNDAVIQSASQFVN